MWSKLSSQTSQKVIGVVVIVFILLAIPLTVWLEKQQQTVQQHAANNGNQQTRTCGNFTLTLTQTESPDCTPSGGAPFGIVNGIPNFQVTTVFSGGPSGDTLQWAWGTYFCAIEDPHASCHSGSVNPGSTTFDSKGNAVAAAPQMSPTNGASACGYYQFDMAFKVLDHNGNQICSFGSLSTPDISNTVYSWCHSGISCNVTTPTPTTTITPTPTVPVTLTPTVTPTPTISTTPTITPTGSVSPTPTTPITGTVTPTTPTTSTPTPTTVIVTNSPTPHPTLPPTGPGNTLLTIGGLGGILTVIGAILLLGL